MKQSIKVLLIDTQNVTFMGDEKPCLTDMSNDCINIVQAVILTFVILFVISVAAMTSAPYSYGYIFKYIIIGDMGVGKAV